MFALTRRVRERSCSSSLVAGALLGCALSTPARAQCGDEVVMKVLDAGTSAPILITPKGAPVIGGDFSFRVFDAPPLGMGFLIYSAFENPVFDPMFGATVYPTPPLFSKSFGTNIQGKSGPLFNASVVTDDICGAFATFQAIVADAGAPGGFVVTNAVRLRVGAVTKPPFAQLVLPPEPSPGALELGDMDEDGIRDLVSLTGSAHVASGLAGGGFGALQTTPLTNLPVSTLYHYSDLADFDGDGHLDLVRKVSVGLAFAFGDGGGGFTGEVISPLATPVSLAHVADLNNDGELDIVAAGEGDHIHAAVLNKNVSVLLGTPSGFFAFPVSYVASTHPDQGAGADVEAADLDEDGDLDLVVAIALSNQFSGQDHQTSVLEGFGNGTFGRPTIYDEVTGVIATPLYRSVSVAVADFDGDTIPDVATTFQVNRRLYRRLGNGDLTLGPVAEFSVGDEPHEIAVADVNDDAIVDLLTRNEASEDVSVLLGDGAGSFTSSGTFGMFGSTVDIATTDIDFDGTLDLLLSNFSQVLQVAGRGDGTFDAAPRYLFARDFVIAADFDGDGVNDLLSHTDTPGILLHSYNADGTFGPAVNVSALDVRKAQAAHMNGDAFIDLVVRQSSGTISVLPGNGDGTFDPETNSFTATGSSFVLADIDGDLFLDIVATRSSAGIDVALGNGDGTFSSPSTFATPSTVLSVAVGDIDGDTLPDIVHTSFGTYGKLLGNGDGTFGSVALFSASGDAPHLSDLDGDGDLDLVSGGGSSLHRHTNDGVGNFSLAQTVSLGAFGSKVAIADMDGDGDKDFVVHGSKTGVVVFWEEPGVFGTPRTFLLAVDAEGLAVGDLDRDGIADIAAADGFASKGRLTIHYSRVGE